MSIPSQPKIWPFQIGRPAAVRPLEKGAEATTTGAQVYVNCTAALHRTRHSVIRTLYDILFSYFNYVQIRSKRAILLPPMWNCAAILVDFAPVCFRALSRVTSRAGGHCWRLGQVRRSCETKKWTTTKIAIGSYKRNEMTAWSRVRNWRTCDSIDYDRSCYCWGHYFYQPYSFLWSKTDGLPLRAVSTLFCRYWPRMAELTAMFSLWALMDALVCTKTQYFKINSAITGFRVVRM